MKRLRTVLYVLMFSPSVVTALVFGFLPERIPAHYGFDGMVTRYGSRWEAFIFPLATIGFGFFMLFMARFSRKHESEGNHNNEKVLLISAIVFMIVFNVLTLHSLYTSYKQVDDLYSATDPMRMIFSLLGLSFVVVGNFMPKLKRNSIMGLRTKWSLSSDEAWRKSQRFGGISFIVTGVLLVVGNVFLFTSIRSFFCSLALILVTVAVCVIYSYRVAQIPKDRT